MARSIRAQRTSASRQNRPPSPIRATTTSVRTQWVLGTSSACNATPPANIARAVRTQARNVRSLASEKRGSGSSPASYTQRGCLVVTGPWCPMARSTVHPSRVGSMSEIPARRLLLVHAHPDDESIATGATMAKYAAEGASVTLVTCTGGERGEILVPELAHLAADQEGKLAEHRRGELADAMRALGVTDHRFLGGFGRYSDSGMAWHEDGHAVVGDDVPDNAFWNADLTEAATLVVEVIREVRPQVMLTYGQFGHFGPPDHNQGHRGATFPAPPPAGPAFRTGLGGPWEIAKIYWT